MGYVYILTITDSADFDKVKQYSVWASRQSAETYAKSLISTLVAKDISGFGNTYKVDIRQMEVFA